VLRAKEHTLTSSPSIIFTFGLVVKSIKELGGASDLIQPQTLKFWPYTFLDVFCKLSSLEIEIGKGALQK
jgi:hypothetical protein